MIAKWALEFPAAYDSACILSGISRLSFSAHVDRSTSLNDLGMIANLSMPVPVAVVILDGVMVLVCSVALT